MTSAMDISDDGIKVLEEREGCKLHAYKDSRGIWTIGVGHTAAAGSPFPVAGLTITQDEADLIFRKDMAPCEAAVNDASDTLSQQQFDALWVFDSREGGAWSFTQGPQNLLPGDSPWPITLID